MDFIKPEIQDYSEKHSSAEPVHLKELNRYTNINVLKPRMLSGHLQGRFLSIISHMLKPQYVLDIGTFTGYSALCLAEGLLSSGVVFTVDNNEELLEIAGNVIASSPYSNQVSIRHGDALPEISKLNDIVPAWDLVWMDADKSEYINYYNLIIDKLRPGGIIMADNVLWSGKVLDEKNQDKDTLLIKEFNIMVNNDERVENLLMPVRDGIMLIRKR